MRLFLIFALALACLTGCATRDYSRHALYADGEAKIDSKLPAAQGRREAVQMAEIQARDRLFRQVLAMKLSDGRGVEQAALSDLGFQAEIMDCVRASHEEPQSREVSADKVKLKMFMERDAIDRVLKEYPGKRR